MKRLTSTLATEEFLGPAVVCTECLLCPPKKVLLAFPVFDVATVVEAPHDDYHILELDRLGDCESLAGELWAKVA